MSSEVRILQVDAFSNRAFGGNPAAVCLLDREASADWMQSVAAEMNLSETAFLLPRGDAFGLRWFTPSTEVPLCGHATLASAHAIWDEGGRQDSLVFATLSGDLKAVKEGDWIRLDLPEKRPEPGPLPAAIEASLGVSVSHHTQSSGFHLVELESEASITALTPDLQALAPLGEVGVIATSRGTGEYDFISRVFAPGLGIDEDPVTGAAHCMLAPYWAERLGRREMTGFQASARGGVVRVRSAGGDVAPGRVHLLGKAVTTLRGALVA